VSRVRCARSGRRVDQVGQVSGVMRIRRGEPTQRFGRMRPLFGDWEVQAILVMDTERGCSY
jgi:hypothetical protein